VHLDVMSEDDSQSSHVLSLASPAESLDDIFQARPRCQAVTFPPTWQRVSMSSQWDRHNTTTNMLAFGNIIVKVLKSQATQNLRWHQESQMALLKKFRATDVAVAATGATKEAHLTDSKLRILRVCYRFEDNAALFSPMQLYLDANREGGTTDMFSWVLHQRVVSVPGATHKCYVHITPKIVAAVKTLNFLANDDRTVDECSNEITPFCTPWRLAKAVNSLTGLGSHHCPLSTIAL
jgi:hypothetical protein